MSDTSIRELLFLPVCQASAHSHARTHARMPVLLQAVDVTECTFLCKHTFRIMPELVPSHVLDVLIVQKCSVHFTTTELEMQVDRQPTGSLSSGHGLVTRCVKQLPEYKQHRDICKVGDAHGVLFVSLSQLKQVVAVSILSWLQLTLGRCVHLNVSVMQKQQVLMLFNDFASHVPYFVMSFVTVHLFHMCHHSVTICHILTKVNR